MRKLSKIIFVIFGTIYSSVFIIFLLLLGLKRKIFIGYIKTKSIGTLATPMEIYKYECLEKKVPVDQSTTLWFRSREIANKILYKKYFHDQIVLPAYMLKSVYDFCKKSSYLKKKFIAPYRHVEDYTKKKILNREQIWQTKDLHDVLVRNKPYVTFSDRELEIGKNYLLSKKIALDDKIVCFSSRGKKFKNEAYDTIRNGKIENQIKSVNFLISKNYKALRMGRNEDQKLDIKENDSIIDYAFDEKNSDLLDLYIFSKCDLLICNGNGINNFATIFRKPKLIVDFTSFSTINTENDKFLTLITPKIYRRKDTKEIVKFSEIFSKDIESIAITDEISRAGYVADFNTEDEILEATKEILEIKESADDIEYKEQGDFWKLVNNYSPFAGNFRISKSFFNKYKEFFC